MLMNDRSYVKWVLISARRSGVELTTEAHMKSSRIRLLFATKKDEIGGLTNAIRCRDAVQTI